jgi:hypothetical protein
MFAKIATRQALHAGKPAPGSPPRSKAVKKYKTMR